MNHDPGLGNVTVLLDHEELPTRVNDSANHVVDFANASTLGRLSHEDPDGSREIVVDKGVGNRYNASLELVDVQVGYNQTYVIQNSTTTTTPLDVMFVIDESCSMRATGCPHDTTHPPTSKMGAAKAATKLFVEELQDDAVSHQAGLVGFPFLHPTGNGSYSGPPQWEVLHHDLSSDLGSVKSEVDGMGRLDWATPMGSGIERGRQRLVAEGNGSHDQVMVLVTDGKLVGGPNDWRHQAELAADQNVTIYTVSIGSSANRTVTKEIANVTGGEEYYVSSATGLTTAFENIYKDVSTTNTTHREIVHNPVAVSMSIDGSPHQPWLSGGSPPPSGLNYPATTGFALSGTQIEDGDVVDVEQGVILGCNGNVTTGETEPLPWNNSKVFNHTACHAPGSPQTTSDDVRLYLDGDPVPTDDIRWWQENLSAMLTGEYARDTDGDGLAEEFDLDSNQVMVVFRMNDSGMTDYNNVVYVFEAGDAESEAKAQWVVDVQVAKVTVENE